MLEIYNKYDTREDGLTSIEVKNKLKEYGENVLPEEKIDPLYIIFLKQYMEPLIYILMAASVISFLVGETVDAIFILIVVTINSIIGTIQEYGAKQSSLALKKIVDVKTNVIRDSIESEISANYLVPGDVVVLKEGSKVPADIILVSSKNLKVDESMLTGESESINKKATMNIDNESTLVHERTNELFAGTIITKGSCLGIVTNTGIRTEIGKIADKLTNNSEVKTPLLERMENFTTKLTLIMGIIIIAIALISYFVNKSDWKEVLLMSASLGVAAIPEGLPIGITICLAIGMNRMAKHNVIVKDLMAVESLGSCTVIASDKTGTLTMNKLTIMGIYDNEDNYISLTEKPKDYIPIDEENNFKSLSNEKKILISFVLPNEAIENNGTFFGDAVDVAFLKTTSDKGYSIKDIKNKYTQIEMIEYSSELKYSASFNNVDKDIYAFVKGAPETIIAMCHMDVKTEILVKKKLDELTKQGLKVLSVACGKVKDSKIEYLKDLQFLALVPMLDPLRIEVKPAIKLCQKAGIKVVMITGDNPQTAFAISKELGFVKTQEEVMTGKELKEAMEKGQEYFDEIVKNTSVYARVEPTQKFDIVESLRRNGNFVAVTGDGVNDAPALKNANVGVAMGKNGTDIARESANIMLMDDNFASIVKGVEEGRLTYSNIRKLIFFLLSTAFAEIGVFILSILFKLPLPFTPLQLLWINIITESVQGIALTMENLEGNEMSLPPRDPNEPIFNKLMLRRVILTSIVMIFGCFITYDYFYKHTNDIILARSVLIFLMVLFQNFQTFNSRSETISMFKQGFSKNPFLFISVFFVTLLHFLATIFSVSSDFLKLTRLSLNNFLTILPIAFILILVIEVDKIIKKKYNA